MRIAKATVGHCAWHIHFNSGQATLSPDAKKLLDELSSDLLVASGTVVKIHGYTDSQATDVPLSHARAAAVRNAAPCSAAWSAWSRRLIPCWSTAPFGAT